MPRLSRSVGLLVLACLFACGEPKPEPVAPAASASAAPEATAPTSAAVTTAPPSASASAPAGPTVAKPTEPEMYYACKSTVKDSEVVTTDVLPHPKGTPTVAITITTKDKTRKLIATVAPHGGTDTLVFDSYDAGDQKPPKEKLVKGKTQIARLVTNGDKRELYATDDFWGKGSDTKAYACGK